MKRNAAYGPVRWQKAIARKGSNQREELLKREDIWARGHAEPRIEDVLSDPIVVAMMDRDGLTRRDVEQVIESLQRHASEEEE
jgi:hypothetical protein